MNPGDAPAGGGAGSDPVPPAPSLEWAGPDRYEIQKCLGHGGMGVVYEALDRERGRLVALKTMLHASPAGLARFKQEFRTLADVYHPNLVQLYDFVADADRAFFTMELVRGVDFRRYVLRPGATPSAKPPAQPTVKTVKLPHPSAEDRPATEDPERQAVRACPADLPRLRSALKQLVNGVAAIHRAGRIHRDIKPSNVLVDGNGRVVVLDFGVALDFSILGRHEGAGGEMVGTALYMAPEQSDDVAPTPAADWYAVGVMLYEALVGRPPFSGSTLDVITLKSTMEAPAPAFSVEGVPADLNDLCMALLNRDPGRRPDVTEIQQRLGSSARNASPAGTSSETDGSTPLIGRERHLEMLRRAYATARAGRPVVVRLTGKSGMGRSAIALRFLEELVSNEQALVLRGRTYEQETVAYKAIDALIDALARHLAALADSDLPVELPRDARALAGVFPVLRGLPAAQAEQAPAAVDPASARRRAFVALREILAALAARQPLVLFLDDVQWGDADSAALLAEVLRPPEAPPLLLLMTSRSELAAASPFLREMHDRWPAAVETVDVEVEPLAMGDARQMAAQLLGAIGESSHRGADAIAHESAGSPFLIEELVRGNRRKLAASDATPTVVSLDRLVGERLGRLVPQARLLVEVVAVSARPIPSKVLFAAANLDGPEILSALSARRLVHLGVRNRQEVVEITHDRIRQTIVAGLPSDSLAGYHRQLAHAWEAQGAGVETETVARHYLGAGDFERGAKLAVEAGEQAAAKLAFDQSARLFQLALDHTPASSPEIPQLRLRLAETLQLAGRQVAGAQAFVRAAEIASPERRVELLRNAAGLYLSAGHLDEGKRILRVVLGAVGIRAPRSAWAALLWLAVYRAWLFVVGLRFEERPAEAVAGSDRIRVDALFTAALSFGMVDVILGACIQARHLIEALRVGDRFQVLRAVSMEATSMAGAGGVETTRERRLVALATALAERHGTREGREFCRGNLGVGLFQRGRWRQAQAMLDLPEDTRSYTLTGLQTARLFSVYTFFMLGDLVENARRIARLRTKAEEQGDLYTLVNLAVPSEMRVRLAHDDPEGARHIVQEAEARWAHEGFHVQHWQVMINAPDVDLYLGDGARAYGRFVATMPRLRRSFLMYAAYVRIMTWFAWVRIVIACAVARPEQRGTHIAEARRLVKRLSREADAWAQTVAALAEAIVENADGNRVSAVTALRTAVERSEQTETVTFGTVAMYRLGQLVGGEKGADLLERARAAMEAQGIREPSRWAAVYMPGRWTADR